MDAQTRHSLKQNELAEALGKLRTFSDPRIRMALIAVAAIAVLYIGYRWWSSARAASLAETWQTVWRFDPTGTDTTGPSLEALREVVRSQGDSPIGAAARLRLATALFHKGRQPEQDRPKLLGEALETLKPVAALSGNNAGFAGAALYMQAVIQETLGDFAAARAAYDTLLNDPRFESSAYRGLATSAVANLDEIAKPTYFAPGMRPPDPPAETPAGPLTLQDQLRPSTPPVVALPAPEPVRPVATPTEPAPVPTPPPAEATPPPAETPPAAEPPPADAPVTPPSDPPTDTPPPATQPAAAPATTP